MPDFPDFNEDCWKIRFVKSMRFLKTTDFFDVETEEFYSAALDDILLFHKEEIQRWVIRIKNDWLAAGLLLPQIELVSFNRNGTELTSRPLEY